MSPIEPNDSKESSSSETNVVLDLQLKVSSLEEKVKSLEDLLLRSHAEFENYKKRSQKEHDFVRENASAHLLSKLLSFIDEFEIALSHMKDTSHAKGMQMLNSKLHDTLKKEGLEEFGKIGETFDPYKHEALRHVEGEDGKIVMIVQKGYLLKGNLLRAAKVCVGNGKSAENSQKDVS